MTPLILLFSYFSITAVNLSADSNTVVWGDTVVFDMALTGGDGSYYMTEELKQPGGDFVGNGIYHAKTGSQFSWEVGGKQPGVYRIRVKVKNALSDKAVKSASVKITVNPNGSVDWLPGGSNHDNILACSLFDCPCIYFECNYQ